MKLVVKHLENEQAQLRQCEFIQWLENSDVSPDDRLSFVPSMLFFIMGFKDILSSAHIENPRNELEHLISTHCEEDLDHWEWYISDLQTLGFDRWGEDLFKFSSQIWSNDSKAARELVYKLFNYHYTKPSLILDLVLIEVLEATFGAFSDAMEKCVKEAGRFEELKFFGAIHKEAEENHTSGSWVENGEVEDIILKFELTESERLLATEMIGNVFSMFEDMFAMWLKTSDEYKSVKQNTTKLVDSQLHL